MSNPHEWHIASDKEGFSVEDELELGCFASAKRTDRVGKLSNPSGCECRNH